MASKDKLIAVLAAAVCVSYLIAVFYFGSYIVEQVTYSTPNSDPYAR